MLLKVLVMCSNMQEHVISCTKHGEAHTAPFHGLLHIKGSYNTRTLLYGNPRILMSRRQGMIVTFLFYCILYNNTSQSFVFGDYILHIKIYVYQHYCHNIIQIITFLSSKKSLPCGKMPHVQVFC